MVEADRPGVVEHDGLEPDTHRLTQRSVRSFVVRNGRQTRAQSDALEALLPRYGLPWSTTPLDANEIWGRSGPCWLEIGFGNGDSLLHLAERYPELNVLGVEVHAPGIGHALNGIEARRLGNVRVVHHDAMEVLDSMIAPASLERILLLFPDPWHKKRHHKRRIVQQEFLDLCARALQPGGIVHMATDWQDYADWMLERLQAHPEFDNAATTGRFATRPAYRIESRFERRGHRLGHHVNDLIFKRR